MGLYFKGVNVVISYCLNATGIVSVNDILRFFTTPPPPPSPAT